MEKIKTFFKMYLKEVCFVVVMALATLCLMATADKQPVNDAVYGAYGITNIFVLFGLLVYGFNRNEISVKKLKSFNYVAAITIIAIIGALILYARYLLQHMPATDIINIGGCGIVCSFGCGWYIDNRTEKAVALEQLKENRPDLYLRKLINMQYSLSENQLFKIFYLEDAENLFAKYLQYGELPDSVEIKLVEQPYFLNMLKHNLPPFGLNDNADSRMFYQPNAPELIWQYVQNGNSFSKHNELKVFNLPNASQIIETYICRYNLSDEGELKMLDLPNAQELLDFYVQQYDLSPAACALAKEKGLKI
ncbi:MAG: hypothetical protein IJ218_06105 [Alphaproteobacteria bacterium]|nr:hypothetical protein [Alphaproteobacteria bacterium]